MQDLARLRIGGGIALLGLERREPAQHAARHAGIAPQHLDRGDQPVAAERGRVPGDAGIRITALRRLGHQHAEVGGGAAQHFVEVAVRGLDRRDVSRLAAQLAVRAEQAAQKRRRRIADRLAAACQQENRPRLVRREDETIDRAVLGQLGRLRVEGERGAPPGIVEPLVAQQHLRLAVDHAVRGRAAPRAPIAAHLEQVGEVVVEAQRERDLDGFQSVIAHVDALVGGALPQEDRACDVDDILVQDDLVAGVDVGIGQVDREQRVVVAHVRAEQQGLRAVQAQFEQREKPRIVVIEPVRSAGRRADVAVAVNHEKCIAMLERAARTRRLCGRRNVERTFRRVRLRDCELQLGVGRHQHLIGFQNSSRRIDSYAT